MEDIYPAQPTRQPEEHQGSKHAKKRRRSEGTHSILSTVVILIAAPLVALLLTTFVFQSYEVDGSSMETTLQNHDRLIVSKVPRTVARITGNDYIPKRGDIIIFSTTAISEGLRNGGQPRQLVKRVIGLPGERVVIMDGKVTIYSKEFPEGFDPDKLGDHGADVLNMSGGNTDIVVGQGEVFVLGDNRNNSSDSRRIGPVPAQDIVGKLKLRVYPLNNTKSF